MNNLFTREEIERDTACITPENEMRENLADMTPFQASLTRAALGIGKIYKRGNLYLSERYAWTSAPNVFPEWMDGMLGDMFSQMPDAPTHWGWCGGDVDKVEWVEI